MTLLATWLLLVLGLLGATDIWLFHTRTQHLHAHAPARAELVTHFLRGPTYCVLFLAVPNLAFHGAWVVALYALLAFDLAISIADFWLEPASRRELGGLPRGEYVLHVLMAMLFGAMVLALGDATRERLADPTALRWVDTNAPGWLRLVLGGMAAGVLWSGFTDLAAVRRLGQSHARSRAPA
jgi:hypothetical protein